MLSQRSLEVFHQVMRFGSIAGAAAELNVSQPAISRHIKDLEISTGLHLFDRTGKRILPTRQAFSLLAEVERAFIGLREIEGRLDHIRMTSVEETLIAGMPILATTIIPDTLADIMPDFRHLRVELQSARTANILPRVAGGLYELGAVGLRRAATGLKVVWQQELPYFCIFPSDHPFSERSEIRVSDLEGQELIGFAETTVTGPQIDKLLAGLAQPPVIRVWVHLSESASSFVMRGHGVAIMDPFGARAHEMRGGKALPFISPATFAIALVTQADKPLTPFLRAFVDRFDEQVKSYIRTEHR